MFIGFAFAGFFGPTIMNKIYISSQSYQNAFLVAIGISMAGVVLTFVFRVLQSSELKKGYKNA